MGVIAPYLIAKITARHNGWLCGHLTVVCMLGAFIGIVAPYEARLGTDPFDFWRRLWPGGVPWDGALYRFGLRRVAGPFAHPIAQGFFFSMIIPCVWWLMDRELLRGKKKLFILSSRAVLLACLHFRVWAKRGCDPERGFWRQIAYHYR